MFIFCFLFGVGNGCCWVNSVVGGCLCDCSNTGAFFHELLFCFCSFFLIVCLCLDFVGITVGCCQNYFCRSFIVLCGDFDGSCFHLWPFISCRLGDCLIDLVYLI
ncbi:hypothetical protein MANES_13G140485v8 [Manihot esculenta]|uniref:Uncharacterized protein n=1 Tax=Manihot esculenta TaxID=3983 RepID=A0ACB7GN06_MANES|nr:hypothetical protein MANES_13G140485v8 [Manihot esculenta]